MLDGIFHTIFCLLLVYGFSVEKETEDKFLAVYRFFWLGTAVMLGIAAYSNFTGC